MKKIKVGVVDSSALLHRARFVSLKEGCDIFVKFLEYIQEFQRKLRCDRIILCNDTHTSRYRLEIDPEYKAHRGKYDKPPSDSEIEAKKLMKSLQYNLHLLSPYFINGNLIGVEADDVIGMLLNDSELKDEFELIAISPDKDMLGAIHISKIFNTNKNDFRPSKDLKGCKNRNEFLLFQSFFSDSTDTLLTLKGIGEKTALKLVDRFKSFKELKTFLSDTSNWENEKDRYLKKAYNILSTEEGWETLGKIFKIVNIFRDTSLLNDSELLRYNQIKQELIDYIPLDFEITEDLDNFVLENNFDYDVFDMLEVITDRFN
jgi:5'-3' exonuclease